MSSEVDVCCSNSTEHVSHKIYPDSDSSQRNNSAEQKLCTKMNGLVGKESSALDHNSEFVCSDSGDDRVTACHCDSGSNSV